MRGFEMLSDGPNDRSAMRPYGNLRLRVSGVERLMVLTHRSGSSSFLSFARPFLSNHYLRQPLQLRSTKDKIVWFRRPLFIGCQPPLILLASQANHHQRLSQLRPILLRHPDLQPHTDIPFLARRTMTRRAILWVPVPHIMMEDTKSHRSSHTSTWKISRRVPNSNKSWHPQSPTICANTIMANFVLL